MKWLPREKRNPFILVVLITAALLALIYFGLIRSQRATILRVAGESSAAKSSLQKMKELIRNADSFATDLHDVTYSLQRAEDDMATGDYILWTYDTMNLFKKNYKVEIPEIGHPTVGDVDLLPSFPYKQIRFGINGTACFHDLGQFVADFENAFPHARMVNLVVEPAAGEGEKLSFRMEIIALVKSNAS
jgi:Tfp pilus assembly protein PilO